MKNGLLNLMIVVALVSITGNVLVYQRYTTKRPLFTVNGKVIRQKDFDNEIDFAYSKQVLHKMIWTILIQQEATKRHCLPTDKDVADAIAELDRSTPSVTYEARKTNTSWTLFKRDIWTKLAIRNLQVADIHPTPSQVEGFYEKHKAMFALPAQSQTAAVVARDEGCRDVARDMLQRDLPLREISTIQGLKVVGVDVAVVGQLPKAISQNILALKPGQIGVYRMRQGFLLVKVKSAAPAGVPPLNRILPRVEMETRLSLAKSETAVLADIRRRATIVVNSDKYAEAVPAVIQ